MQIVLVILSAGLLGLIIYFAVSPKSSKLVKKSALIALALIGISIGVCVFFLVKGPGQDPAAISLPVFQDTPTTQARKANVPAIVILILVLLAIAGLIVVGIKRDKRDSHAPVSESKAPPAFNDSEELELGDESLMKDDDDSFDIDI